MNPIHSKTLETANEAAIYTLYLYLAHKTNPADRELLRAVVDGLTFASSTQNWNARDRYRLRILQNAVDRSPMLADSRIGNLTRSESGMTACSFTNPDNDVFIVFRGTGSGEWIDNGKGLSGIPEENTYITYAQTGSVASAETVHTDYATDQQVEALNWFRRIIAQNGWNADTVITLAGHSKGGNKAQFITIHSDLVDACFSFDGHGFSPEALAALKEQYGAEFTARRYRISSLSAENDYVNVLGQRLMPDTRIHYFESFPGIHYLESMLDVNGRFRPQCEQGKLSQYVESVSTKLMRMPPSVRQKVTQSIMDIFQQHFENGGPVNVDAVSPEKTVAGIAAAIGPLLHSEMI